MNWPDWFGRKAKVELVRFKAMLEENEACLRSIYEDLQTERENNLRLIAQLREMDQGLYSLVQVAPNWPQMQPIVARLNEKVEKRMATENNRIRNLMVGEIASAYNEPPKLRKFNQGEEVFHPKQIEGKKT
jgi:chromosome condensin MukBEF ATPase and DNA-binding subunit MukB